MDRRVRVIQRRNVFDGFFRIEEVQLEHERYDGSTTGPITRLIFHRGDAVAVLLHDPAKRSVLLCEQFRTPTVDNGPGWLVELPAGVIEHGEDPETCARREMPEETGYEVTTLQRIATIYPSPGGSSERIHIFYAPISFRDDAKQTGGLASEGEDIKLMTLPDEQAIAQARDGRILDAKTMIALQWLALRGA